MRIMIVCVNCIQETIYRGGRGGGREVNGHALWEKLKFSESQKWHFGDNGIPCVIIHTVIVHFIVIIWG